MAETDERRVRTEGEQNLLDELATEEEKETYLSLEKHRNGLFRDFLKEYAQYVSICRSGEFNKERLELFITDEVKQLLKNNQLECAMELARFGKEFSALPQDAINEIVRYLSWKDEKQLRSIVSMLLRCI